jgi:putative transposase
VAKCTLFKKTSLYMVVFFKLTDKLERSNRVLDIFGEKFPMPVDLEYEYVWVTIDTENETLSIYHDSILIDKLDYPLPKTYIELSKIDL